MKEMQRWLRDYDRLRLDPDTPNESWISSKYDIQGIGMNCSKYLAGAACACSAKWPRMARAINTDSILIGEIIGE